MALKKYFIIVLVAIMAMVLSWGAPIAVAQESSPESSPGLHTGWMMETYDGYNGTWSCNRTFKYYIPTSFDNSTAVPLLFSLHGMGSNGLEQIDLTKFDVLAEQEGFIAVFPDSTNLPRDEDSPCYPSLEALEEANPLFAAIDLIQWNIGTNLSLQYCAGVDDVGFVNDTVQWFKANYNIDTSRIYATGFSNGAQFSHYLALMLPGTFAGIAPVAGPLTTNTTWPDVTPLTVIMMHAPTDPIVPYDGEARASIYSVNDTINFWCTANNITSGPVTTTWGPWTPVSENTTITSYVYSGGTNGTQVVLFKMEGCKTVYYVTNCVGHTWPGGPQYADPFLIGYVSNQTDGSAQIWKYFSGKNYLMIHSSNGGSVTTPTQSTLFYEPSATPTQVSLVATPSSGYEFVNWTWTLNAGSIGNANSPSTTITIIPNKDYEIKANFQPESTTPPPSGGCFIATAAYGTPTAEQLDVLREFRDDVLLKSTVGSRLVDLYYRVSPPIADFISEHNFVRTLVRELLIDPIVWLVEATGDIWRN
jgi:polyhydroxybutyrate depolymerase